MQEKKVLLSIKDFDKEYKDIMDTENKNVVSAAEIEEKVEKMEEEKNNNADLKKENYDCIQRKKH